MIKSTKQSEYEHDYMIVSYTSVITNRGERYDLRIAVERCSYGQR